MLIFPREVLNGSRGGRSKYVIGLSATVARKEGHHPVIFTVRTGAYRSTRGSKPQLGLSSIRSRSTTGFRLSPPPEPDARAEFNKYMKQSKVTMRGMK